MPQVQDRGLFLGPSRMGLSLSSRRVSSLVAVMRELAHPRETVALRRAVGPHLLDLFEADYLASYAWSAARGRFESGVQFNMDPHNLARYEAYYQFHDPITLKLQARKRATAVVEIMPQAALAKTEFFNDFLHRDGLYWGMNVYAYDGACNIGDLRVWRSRGRDNFSRDDLALLDGVGSAFATALAAGHCLEMAGHMTRDPAALVERFGLTAREADVAVLVAQGLADDDIAAQLAIGHATVRTHLGRVFGKAGVTSRAALAALIFRAPHQI